MKLTLLRHGITEGNRRRLYYGSTDLPLLQEGWEALEDLRAQGGYPTATRYYTSGMIRTEQTLLALYGPVSHEVLPGLREMDFGAFEMRSYEELEHDPAYLAWLEGDVEANLCPGGESGQRVTTRALEALARHRRPAGSLVSPGRGAIRLDTCTREGLSGGAPGWDTVEALGCTQCIMLPFMWHLNRKIKVNATLLLMKSMLEWQKQ